MRKSSSGLPMAGAAISVGKRTVAIRMPLRLAMLIVQRVSGSFCSHEPVTVTDRIGCGWTNRVNVSVTRGFTPLNEKDPIMAGAVDRIVAAIERPGDHISEVALLKTQIKDGVSRYLYEQTKRRPMVFPVVVEV